jgi:hypothetical protein
MIHRDRIRTAVEPLVTPRLDVDVLTEAAARRAGHPASAGYDEALVAEAIVHLARCERAAELRPDLALSDEGARLADLQLAELAVELLAQGTFGRQALEALRICFWWTYWVEAGSLPATTAQELTAAWDRCAAGAGGLTQRHLQVARDRARRAVRDWAASPPRAAGPVAPTTTMLEVDLAPNVADYQRVRYVLAFPAPPRSLRLPAPPPDPSRN